MSQKILSHFWNQPARQNWKPCGTISRIRSGSGDAGCCDGNSGGRRSAPHFVRRLCQEFSKKFACLTEPIRLGAGEEGNRMKDGKQMRQQEVADRARVLWEQAGQPGGRDEEFWFRAETELLAESSTHRPPVIHPPRPTRLPPVPTSPVNEVPPPIRGAVKTPSRRPPRLGSNKRPPGS